MIELSIIIINYNTYKYTSNCINSIYDKCKDLKYEIILIDNASSEINPIEFDIIFPKIKYIKSDVNLGFAGGNNLGIKYSEGSYILLLNSDTELINNAPKICLDFLKSKKNKGLITSQLIYPNGVIQNNSRRFRTIYWEILEIIPIYKFLKKNKAEELMLHHYFDHKRQTEADWIWGTFMLFDKSIIHLLPNKKLSEDFWMYCEDVLWSWEFRKLGHKAYFIPEAKVMHIHGASSTNENKNKFKWISINNHAIFMKKYYPDIRWYIFSSIYYSKQISNFIYKKITYKINSLINQSTLMIR